MSVFCLFVRDDEENEMLEGIFSSRENTEWYIGGHDLNEGLHYDIEEWTLNTVKEREE